MNTTQKQIIALYLEYVNDFISTERFSEYHGISEEFAKAVIKEGKRLHELASYKTSYRYAIIVKNGFHLSQESTLLESDYLRTKYALMERQCYLDKPEKLRKIIYSDSLKELTEKAEKYISWYNYPDGEMKDIQGNISKIS